jgi:hypothetical protein
MDRYRMKFQKSFWDIGTTESIQNSWSLVVKRLIELKIRAGYFSISTNSK